MRDNDHSYFQNRQCKYFPCHTVEDEDEFNCLFCYCPLYMLGDKCGGSFVYTERGIKNCRNCALPHSAGGYEHVLSKFSQISDLARRKEAKE